LSITAVEKLAPGHLASGKQLELLGGDLDLTNFFIQMRDKAGINLVSAITDATVDRTIEGASTLVVTVEDNNSRDIQLSGKLGRKVDVNVDGLWWTLVGVRKSGNLLTLTFEERVVNIFRYYNKFIYASRKKMNRAHFVLRLIQEPTEQKIPYVIPELDDVQKISDIGPNQILLSPDGAVLIQSSDPAKAALQREQGIHYGTALTVKGAPATPEQIDNANIILATCLRLKAPVKVEIAAINTAITESRIINVVGDPSDPAHNDSTGVFQQRRSQGWPATRDIPTDAAAFIQRAMQQNHDYPNLTVAMLCQNVQHSAYADGSNYAPWTDEAIAFVQAYGSEVPQSIKDAYAQAVQQSAQTQSITSASANQGDYFIRGTISKKNSNWILEKEDSWHCMTRLANEINWRAFVVSGVVYYISEDYLFKSKPYMNISEDSDGIDWIDYDYDEGKRQATLTINAHFSRWSAPPGSTIQINNMGIIDGKWLVQDASRSVFNTQGTITCIKPLPKLPEPVSIGQLPTGLPSSLTGGTGTPPAPSGNSGGKETTVANLTENQARVISYATQQLGVPYEYGAERAGVAFDCSGLAQAAYEYAHISIPRVAQAQYDAGPVVLDSHLQPADLVFFGDSRITIEHVGIYIGNGSMINAPNTGSLVRVDNGFTTWTNPPYFGATRPWQQ
jgi:cell wall-associated NlpC family hydrolase